MDDGIRRIYSPGRFGIFRGLIDGVTGDGKLWREPDPRDPYEPPFDRCFTHEELVTGEAGGFPEDLVAILCKAARAWKLAKESPSPVDRLIGAAASGDAAACVALVCSGVPVDARDWRGVSALYAAVHHGHLDVIEALLAAGADPNAKIDDEITGGLSISILETAFRREHFEVTPTLVRHGARGWGSPIERAFERRAPVQILDALEAAGARLDTGARWAMVAVRDYPPANPLVGWLRAHGVAPAAPDPPPPPPPVRRRRFVAPSTPSPEQIAEELVNAVAEADLTKIDALLQAGRDPRARNTSGWPPMVAVAKAKSSHAEIIAKLVGAGASVDDGDRSGATALVKAVRLGATGAARALVAAGADPNCQDEGRSALAWAARDGQAEIVAALLAAGADASARDTKGATALDHAREKHHESCVALLRAPP